MAIEKKLYGTLPDGREVYAYRISNGTGLSAEIINYGGIVTKLETYDKDGNIKDVVLGRASLEEYLEICKNYQMTPVIELKGENNTQYYNEIVNLAEKYNLKPVYISFHLENLKTMRKLDTTSKMYYLVQKISEKDIEDARSILDCGIDFNGNKEANFKNDILKKCRDQGLDLGAWTINDPEVMKKLEKNGVTLITTDSIEYDK